MIKRSIPVHFVTTCHQLNWQELLLGLKEGWLDIQDVVESFDSIKLFDLRSPIEKLQISVDTIEMVAELQSSLEFTNALEVRGTWLRLLLAWIFENKSDLIDPLQYVEQLYTDFDYPDEMYDLVRYNPPLDGYRPQDHSKEENMNRLFRLWAEYCSSNLNRNFAYPSVSLSGR
jgi:hypothetical protein